MMCHIQKEEYFDSVHCCSRPPRTGKTKREKLHSFLYPRDRVCVCVCVHSFFLFECLSMSSPDLQDLSPRALSSAVKVCLLVSGQRLTLADLQHGQRPHPEVQPHQRHPQHHHAQRGHPRLPLESQSAPRGPGQLSSPVSDARISPSPLNSV